MASSERFSLSVAAQMALETLLPETRRLEVFFSNIYSPLTTGPFFPVFCYASRLRLFDNDF